MTGDEALAFWSSRSLTRLLLLTGLGGVIGGGQVVLGLLLGAGGARFALAFLMVGGLVLAATDRIDRPWVTISIQLSTRVGVLALALILGQVVGFVWLGRATPDSLPSNWMAGWLMIAVSLVGVGVGATSGLNYGSRWTIAGLGLGFIAGVVGGVVLGRYFSLESSKFSLWGAGSGVGLSTSLSYMGWIRHARRTGSAAAFKRIEAFLVFSSFFFVVLSSCMPQAWDDTGHLSLYVYQARSFLAGRLDVDIPFESDTAQFEGRVYLPFQPLPALVLLPFVWLQGDSASPIYMSVISSILAAISVVLLKELLERLRVVDRFLVWIPATFVFGTGYWMATRGTDGGASKLAQVVAVLCLLFGFRETFGHARGLVAGVFLGMAFLSRPLTILAVFFMVASLLSGHRYESHSAKAKNLLWFLAGLGFCLCLGMAFNYLRFRDAFETGYLYQVRPGFNGARVQQYGLFSLAYLPYNAYYTFLHGFNIEFQPPLLVQAAQMDSFGTSLTVASPFLFLALLARGERWFTWGAWSSVGLTLLAHLLWMSNGRAQLNTQRFMLDYLPILILLVALAAPRIKPQVFKGLTLWSIGLNLIVISVFPWSR